MCGITNYTVLRNDKAIAFMVEERDARLFVEAPVMCDLLKETLRYFSEHDIDSQLKLDIDDCLLRIDGSHLQGSDKSMSEELKPCPFCGTNVRVQKRLVLRMNGDYYVYEIKCENCGCNVYLPNNGTFHCSDEEAKANAIKAWNRRVPSQT